VNRQMLGEIVFGDCDELEALNSILHPRIRGHMVQQITRAQNDDNVKGAVVDAAVLFEAGCEDLCTHVVFVDATRELREQRVSSTRGWDKNNWMNREKFQISLDKKRALCHYIVDNSSSISHLYEQVCRLFYQIVHAGD
ncbi:MAG: dephospho-CoA kinase, partial [Deltaproteobacteria bacterium]|nr:dephospho-CoA kinase [Deltaproteobacteria bacterium]